jgi:hypothetical protein
MKQSRKTIKLDNKYFCCYLNADTAFFIGSSVLWWEKGLLRVDAEVERDFSGDDGDFLTL